MYTPTTRVPIRRLNKEVVRRTIWTEARVQRTVYAPSDRVRGVVIGQEVKMISVGSG